MFLFVLNIFFSFTKMSMHMIEAVWATFFNYLLIRNKNVCLFKKNDGI